MVSRLHDKGWKRETKRRRKRQREGTACRVCKMQTPMDIRSVQKHIRTDSEQRMEGESWEHAVFKAGKESFQHSPTEWMRWWEASQIYCICEALNCTANTEKTTWTEQHSNAKVRAPSLTPKAQLVRKTTEKQKLQPALAMSQIQIMHPEWTRQELPSETRHSGNCRRCPSHTLAPSFKRKARNSCVALRPTTLQFCFESRHYD